jgi:uncharacterized protein
VSASARPHDRTIASDATPEIVALQEEYGVGAINWTMIDASRTPEQTLERCRSAIAL